MGAQSSPTYQPSYSSKSECVLDAAAGGLVLAVDALRVHLEDDVHAVPGPSRNLRCRNAGVEPQGDGGVPQVVGLGRQGRALLCRCQGRLPRPTPGVRVGPLRHRLIAVDGDEEQPAVRRMPERGEVPAQGTYIVAGQLERHG